MLYFLARPGAAVTHDELRLAGIDYAFEDLPASREVTGPEGARGKLLAASGFYSPLEFKADQQTWRRATEFGIDGPNVSTAWIGCYHNLRPDPSFYQRKEMLAGQPVGLADGREWLVPTARQWIETDEGPRWVDSLPKYVTFSHGSQGGEPGSGESDPRYRRLNEFAHGLLDGSLDIRGQLFGAVDALSVNYRIGRAEVEMLRLFLDRGPQVNDIQLAVIDAEGFNAITDEKKTEPQPALTGAA